MADEERKILIDLEVEDTDFDKEIGEVNKQLRNNRDLIKELSQDYENNASEIAKLERENKKLSKSKRDLIKQSDIENNSLNALRARLSQLTAERNNLNTGIEGNVDKFNQLQREIKQTSDEIKEFEQAGGDFRRNVGNYTASIEEAIGSQQVFGVSVGDIFSKVGLLTAGVGALGAGLLALGKAWASSARGAQALERASDRLNIVQQRLGNTLADLTDQGGGVDLLDKALFALESSLFGVGNALETQILVGLREAQREFEIIEPLIQRTLKTQLDAAEQLRQVRDDDRNSIEERIDANNRLRLVLEARAETQIAFLDQQIEGLRTQLKADENNRQLQQQINQLLFERADIQEETQGFLSEQIVNENALLKEQRDEIIAVQQAELALLQARDSASRQEVFEKSKQILSAQLDQELQLYEDNEKRKQEIRLRYELEYLNLKKEFGMQAIEVERIGFGNINELVNKSLENFKVAKKEEQSISKTTADFKRAQNQQLFGAINNLIFSAVQDQKAAGLIQLGVDTGVAIGGALRNSQSPTPDNIATGGIAGIAKFVTIAATIVANSIRAVGIIKGGPSGGGGGFTSSGAGRTARGGVSANNGIGIIQPQLLDQFSTPVQNQVGLENAARTQDMRPIYVNVTDISKAQVARDVKVSEGKLG